MRVLIRVLVIAAVLAATSAWAGGVEPEATSVRLKPGDGLLIILPGSDLDERKVELDARGEVDLEAYGRVELVGLEVTAAQDKLRGHLRPLFRNTDALTVTLISQGRLIKVTGLVAKPGLVTLSADTDLWQAIQLAGGSTPGSDLTRVEIMRGDRTVTYDLMGFLTRDGARTLPLLEPGDTVVVPARRGTRGIGQKESDRIDGDALVDQVLVLGAVKKPGLFPRPRPMEVWVALALAGGPVEDAELSAVHVKTSRGSTRVDLAAAMQHGTATVIDDSEGSLTIFVPSRKSADQREVVPGANVLGGVVNPGRVTVTRPLPLEDVITLAGGPSDTGDLARVTIVRRVNGATLSTTYDIENRIAHGQAPVMVEPGDTVVVGYMRDNPITVALGAVSQLAIVASLATVLLNLVPIL